MTSSGRRTPPEEPPAERNTVLLIVVGVLAALSVVIAALVIFSSGEGPAKKPEAAAPVRAGDQSLVVGKPDARTKVVVYEDLADPDSRAFEIASRDFLRIEAAKGGVQVEYRPFVVGADDYASEAYAAWAAVLSAGTPKQALAFHDLLVDRQPEPGQPAEHDFVSWAKSRGIDDSDVVDALDTPDARPVEQANQAAAADGVTRVPTVQVQGEPLNAGSPVALADKLQRLLLDQE